MAFGTVAASVSNKGVEAGSTPSSAKDLSQMPSIQLSAATNDPRLVLWTEEVTDLGFVSPAIPTLVEHAPTSMTTFVMLS
jgi:hypothetical protein